MNYEKVAKMLADYLNIGVEEVKAESTFEELKLDSLDIAELVMSMEDEFGISIDLDENVKTVADLVALIDGADK